VSITGILCVPVSPLHHSHQTTITLQGINWGTYRHLDICPPGTYAVDFQTKVEDRQGGGDDTAMNAVSLGCSDGHSKITSGKGDWGTWGHLSPVCHSGFIGARIKVEASQGGGDDSGTNAIQFFCHTNGRPYKSKEGPWGDWRRIHYCPTGYKITGIRTQIEPRQHSGDDSALNSVQLQCTFFGDDIMYDDETKKIQNSDDMKTSEVSEPADEVESPEIADEVESPEIADEVESPESADEVEVADEI